MTARSARVPAASSPERIAALVVVPAEGFGGAERQAVAAIRRLPDFGVDVVPLVGPGTRIVDALQDGEAGYFVHSPDFPRAPEPDGSPVRRAAEYLASFARVTHAAMRLADTRPIDVVYAVRSFGWLVGGAVGRARDLPVVWRAGSRAERPIQQVGGWLASRALHPAVTVFNSLAVRDSLGGWLGGRQELLANAVDTDRFHPEGIAPSYRRELALDDTVPVVGIPARPAPEKGFGTLPALICRLRNSFPRLRVLVAGEYPWRARYEAECGRLGLGQTIVFLGHVRRMESFYASCDVVLLPSTADGIEGAPNALLEAMSMERAVCGSRVGGIPELIEDGTNGRLIEPEDPAAADVLVDLLWASDLRRRLGVAARRYVVAHHAEALVIRRLAEILRGEARRGTVPTHSGTG